MSRGCRFSQISEMLIVGTPTIVDGLPLTAVINWMVRRFFMTHSYEPEVASAPRKSSERKLQPVLSCLVFNSYWSRFFVYRRSSIGIFVLMCICICIYVDVDVNDYMHIFAHVFTSICTLCTHI